MKTSKNSKNNKFFLALLSGSSLVIWGIIVYQILWGMNYDSGMDDTGFSAPVKQQETVIESPGNEAFSGKGKNIRNPFKPAYIQQKQKSVPKPRPMKNIAPAPQPPEIRYIGFLADQRGCLAILETTNGNTSICSVGDSLQGIHLTKIERNQVSVSFKGRFLQLPLRP